MGRRAVLKGSYTQDDFLREYKECKDPEEKTRWHAMLLLCEKKTFVEIAATLHVTTRVLSKWLRRYNLSGADGLKDQRKEARGGRPSPVSPDVQNDLQAALASPSPDGGHWTGPKARCWLEGRVGRRFAHNFGWRWLRRLGFSFQRPRPRSHKAELSVHEDAKKNSTT